MILPVIMDKEYFIDCDHFSRLCHALLEKTRNWHKEYDAIICPLRGGFFLSYFMSHHLNLSIKYLEISSYKGSQQRDFLFGIKPDLNGGRYLLCDDIYDTGNTVKKIREIYNDIDIDIVCLLSKRHNPDITYGELVDQNKWVTFFWEKL